MAIIKPNNNTISAITALPAAIPTGKVLQTVSATSVSQTSTTSTSFVATNLKATITPSSSSNKIIILVTGDLYNEGSEKHTSMTVYRGGVSSGTNIGHSTYGFADTFAVGGGNISPGAAVKEDSPSTTSATLYEVAVKVNDSSSAGYFGVNNTMTSIVLMEIGA